MTDKKAFSVVTLVLVATVVLAVMVYGVWLFRSLSSSEATAPNSAAQVPVVSMDDKDSPVEIMKQLMPAGEISKERDEFDGTPPDEFVSDSEEVSEWRPSQKAVASLKDAMRHGDPRTPRLAESQQREQASAQELADPVLYLEYEARQKEQVYRSFIKASETKIIELEALIAKGERDGGVTDEQLAEGRRKLEALRRSREEVLAEHPLAGQVEADTDSIEGAGSDSEAP